MRVRQARKQISLLAAAAVLTAGLAMLGGPIASAGASVAETGAPPNDGSKASVAAAYQSQWAPTTKAALSPTGGSNSSCKPWVTSSAAQSSTLQAINFARWMTGAEPVTFDQTLSNKAARAAQMMVVNNALDHAPPSSWTCYSTDGREAASQSNLGFFGGSQTAGGLLNLYLNDPGTGNRAAGHRRWILYPETGAMGSGNARSGSGGWDANALWVLGNNRTSTNPPPSYSAWPTAGYFPRQLEPDGRWSFSTSRSDVSLSGATVSVRNAAGGIVPLTQHPQSVGFGLDTIVWDFNSMPATGSGAEEVRYVVTVSGIKVGGVSQSPHSYNVRLFDGMSASANGGRCDAESPNPFSDVVVGQYFTPPVLWMVANGITVGTSATKFSPHQAVVRAQIATFFWRDALSPIPETFRSFSDVPDGVYYSDAVSWMVDNQITAGTSSSTFSPQKRATRGEVAAFLHRLAGEPAPRVAHGFSDVSASSYYDEAVSWLVGEGITSGTSPTSFSPGATVTRAQIATFLHRRACG